MTATGLALELVRFDQLGTGAFETGDSSPSKGRFSRNGRTYTKVAAAVRPADQPCWAHRRFQDVDLSDPLLDVLFFTTFECDAPPGFEHVWQTFLETVEVATVPLRFDRCDSVSTLVVLADPSNARQLRSLRVFIESLDLLGHDAPPVLWLPHTVAPEVRTAEQRDAIMQFGVVSDLMDMGLDGIVHGEPSGNHLALELALFAQKSVVLNKKWEDALSLARNQTEYVLFLNDCIHNAIWEYLRPRIAPSIPPMDPVLPDGELRQVGGYVFGPLLGKGACGSVYAVSGGGIGSQHVMKVVSKKPLMSVSDLKQTNRHIGVERCLAQEEHDHPNIVKLLQVYHSKTHLYFLQEFAGNENLFRRLNDRDRGRRPMIATTHYALMMQALAAVIHLHSGPSVCHRDIKPENFVLQEMGHSIVLRLADFELAVQMTKEGRCGTPCGTFPFAAPEIFLERSYSGFAADIWALAIVLMELVCAVGVFEAIYGIRNGSPTLECMTRVKAAVVGRLPSKAGLSSRCNADCAIPAEAAMPIFDGMLQPVWSQRLTSEEVKTLKQGLRPPA